LGARGLMIGLSARNGNDPDASGLLAAARKNTGSKKEVLQGKILTCMLLVALACLSLQAAPEGSKPNIVFTLIDDQGYGDLGCYGSNDIATPSIDRLRKEGMTFDCFYVHNRCAPTRAAFMTGSHAGRNGLGRIVHRWQRNGISDEEITVAELLNDSGYATGIVGK
jgi:hypothetical protein